MLIGKLQGFIYRSPTWCRHSRTCSCSFGKSFASLGIMQYICAKLAPWWNGSVVSNENALKFNPLSMQIILDWIGFN
jgi:hypothetical protein